MGNGNKVEFLVAICALIASSMAVYMAWDQGRVMRAQQHGAVFPVLQVDFSEAEPGLGFQQRQSRFFQVDIVVVVQVVQTHHGIAACQQFVAGVKADKTCGTGY